MAGNAGPGKDTKTQISVTNDSSGGLQLNNLFTVLKELHSPHVTKQWHKLVTKLSFKKDKICAILAFLDELNEHESVGLRDKIIEEFDQTTYQYISQFPIVLSMPPMDLPRTIYDYQQCHIQQLYCRSQMRQIEAHCQMRDLALVVRDELLRSGSAYDSSTVEPLAWASII